jgi:hypothetical protein
LSHFKSLSGKPFSSINPPIFFLTVLLKSYTVLLVHPVRFRDLRLGKLSGVRTAGTVSKLFPLRLRLSRFLRFTKEG